ncbi:MAG: hypothetical protein AAF804_09330 [Bacteroidota bacterium]
MGKSKWILALLCLMGALSLSAQAERPTSPVPGRAMLKIYQKSSYGSNMFMLKINDQVVADPLHTRHWFMVQVPPGRLTLETAVRSRYPTYESKTFYLDVEPDKIYYLEAVTDFDFLISRLYLYQSEAGEASSAIKKMKYDEESIGTVD